MHEEDRAPVTLTEIYHQADACQRPVERAEKRRRIFDKFLPLKNYTDIVITGCGSSHQLAKCASFAWSEMLKRPRDLNPDAPLHLVRTVAPDVEAVAK